MVLVRVLSVLLCAEGLRVGGPHVRPTRRVLCPPPSSLVAGLVGLAIVASCSPVLASDAPPEPSLQSSLDFISVAPSIAPAAATPQSASGSAPQQGSVTIPTESDLARAIDAASKAGSNDPRAHGPAPSTGEKT